MKTLKELWAGQAPPKAHKPDYYFDLYQEILGCMRDEPISLLELGIAAGGSILLWQEYFSQALITAIDLKVPELANISKRVDMFVADQANPQQLNEIALRTGPYDVIIDDCSHIAKNAAASFLALFDKHLRPGGYYFIEDWGTGYWPVWPDGGKFEYHPEMAFERQGRIFPSHQYGMVGWLKQIIDEVGLPDIVNPHAGNVGDRKSQMEWILVKPAIAVVKKS